MDASINSRKFPIGAEVVNEGVHFRVWAPYAKTIHIALEKQDSHRGNLQIFPLKKENTGYFSGLVKEATSESLYHFKIDNQEQLYPDPASRYQPGGPHGPSQVVSSNFNWTDQNWKGVHSRSKVIYEMHIGTFTQEGTWNKAKDQLQELADIGINIIEMMPIAEFPGHFGWGYDGVNLFAPYHLYGSPDELKEFINHAHQVGIAVILDVVYNHFGPDGNYMNAFSTDYFTSKYTTEWGEAINFDGPNSHEVREFYISNACYWIQEYHFDGLRFDATQSIFDDSSIHILREISQQIRQIDLHREKYLIAENEPQLVNIVQPIEKDGFGLDALWNDDFHHSAIVRLTGHNEAYYTDYFGSPQEFISTFKYGYLYQGQWYLWQNKNRGVSSLDLEPSQHVNFIQNHDQIANLPKGLRIHQLTDSGNFRTMSALLLIGPQTPLLFQGQEFGSSSPFYYFADHHKELTNLIMNGRNDYFKQFRSYAQCEEIQNLTPEVNKYELFLKCKLSFDERHSNHEIYQMHKDLLKLRHEDSVFKEQKKGDLDGAILNADSFILRFFGKNQETRLVIVNFGVDFLLSPVPEPLIAPPIDHEWEIYWSSEHPMYGGGGFPSLEFNSNWRILGHSLTIYKPKKVEIKNA